MISSPALRGSAWALALPAVLLGCPAGQPPDGGHQFSELCSDDTECAGKLVCVPRRDAGLCTMACIAASECAARLGPLVNCVDGVCVHTCDAGSATCPSGTECHAAAGFCVVAFSQGLRWSCDQASANVTACFCALGAAVDAGPASCPADFVTMPHTCCLLSGPQPDPGTWTDCRCADNDTHDPYFGVLPCRPSQSGVYGVAVERCPPP